MGVVIHRIRTGYIRERTATMNRIGSILTEFGFSFPRGHANMKRLFQWLAEIGQAVHPLLIFELRNQLDHYNELNDKIKEQDKKLGPVDLYCTNSVQQYIGSHIIENASDTILA